MHEIFEVVPYQEEIVVTYNEEESSIVIEQVHIRDPGEIVKIHPSYLDELIDVLTEISKRIK